MIYEHECRDCNLEWQEEYSLETFDVLKAREKETGEGISCPDCESTNTFRHVNYIPVHFKGGGWSPQGYYQYEAYDTLQAQGKKITLYDRKEDLDRVMEGEKRQRIIRRMKREDEIAKRTLGPDAAFTEKRAEKALAKRMKKDEP